MIMILVSYNFKILIILLVTFINDVKRTLNESYVTVKTSFKTR